MILSLRTDNPNAEIGLHNETGQLRYHVWPADRQLAKDLLRIIHEQLAAQNADWQDVTGVVIFEGPGSFTGLRIGITVANTVAYGQNIPIVGSKGDNWLQSGLAALRNGKNDKLVLPYYGRDAHITLPKK